MKKRTVDSLNELSASYEEMAKALNGIASELENTRHLWGKPHSKQGCPKLIKLGWALITIPVLMMGVKKTLGTLLITAGLVQEKLRYLHATNVYDMFKEVSKECKKLILWNKYKTPLHIGARKQDHFITPC